MKTVLLIIGLVVIFDVLFVWLMGGNIRIRRQQQISRSKSEIDVVIFRAKFFNPRLQVWCGYFYFDKERKRGYMSNLKREHLHSGACCSARIIEFDNSNNRWKLESLCKYE